MTAMAKNVPVDIQKLYDKLQTDVFCNEDVFIRPTTSLVLKDEKWWEIALVRGGYEGLLHIDSTEFVYSEKSPKVAEYELESVFYFKLKWGGA